MEHFRKKDEINIDNVRHTIVRNNDIRFAEFELGGDERDTPIPARKPSTVEGRQNGNLGGLQEGRAGAELSLADLNFWDEIDLDGRASISPDASNERNIALREKGLHSALSSQEASNQEELSPSGENDRLHMADIPLQSITVSAVTQASPPSAGILSSEGVRYYSREQQFVIRARELAWHVELEHPFVPFKSYWPTYDNMSSAQYKWYFYWREEVRSGRYPDTDLSYLFLYMYELINGIGWSNPAQGWQLLDSVWNAYRQRFPKLDSYAKEWLFDFSLIHELDMPVMETYNRIPRSLSSELKELEWLRRFTAQPLTLNWDLLNDLMDYEPNKSRFYQEGGRKDMKTYGPKVVALVDAYLGKTKGQRLIDIFKPRERMQERYIFRSAVYDYDIYGRTASVMTLPISGHAPLRHYITNLIRMMENKLRELRGFKGRLRGIEVDPEIEKLVARFLKKEIHPAENDSTGKMAHPEVQIDRAKLWRIQQESDDVRDMLLVDGPENSEPIPGTTSRKESYTRNVPIQMDIFEMDRVADDSVLEPPTMMSVNEKKGLFTEEALVVDIESVDHLACIGNKDAEEQASAPVSDHLALQQSTANEPSTTIAITQSTANKPLAATATLPDVSINWDTKNLDSEWRELAEQLTPAHLEALYALKVGSDLAMLQAAAERAGSMPALLIDEINDTAMETIGDLLIDGETLVDEYIAMLDQLTR
ncbi:TerB N-terminal domain-containing protein [Paenibacillus sp. N3/727]|uniref:TerB N-terminal domain-containing protein n=1 Tax=Paenibacillus sp. N3/727 TaxID=2925845 RepID=UPI001F52B76F|nr:TerB N-terminal domain-containing protein [Paenibacillus sp. N3/727]UNK18695.1 TerB N-terminal domain-containing protein [Paenibacillus sp. N3/727]